MEQYISKSALVAEIKRRLWLLVPKMTFHQQRVELEKLLSFIDTLEVKEVDLEDYNKVKGTLSLSFMQFLDSHRQEGKMCLSNGECFDIDKAFDEMDFAKLFRYMEKYLKAQKGEKYA